MGDQTELTVAGKRKTVYILGNICGGRKRMEKSIFFVVESTEPTET